MKRALFALITFISLNANVPSLQELAAKEEAKKILVNIDAHSGLDGYTPAANRLTAIELAKRAFIPGILNLEMAFIQNTISKHFFRPFHLGGDITNVDTMLPISTSEFTKNNLSEFSQSGSFLYDNFYNSKGNLSVIYDLQNYRFHMFYGPNAPQVVAISRDNSLMALYSVREGLKLYNLSTGKLEDALGELGEIVAGTFPQSMEFSSNGEKLLIGLTDGRIIVYNVLSKEIFERLLHNQNIQKACFLDDDNTASLDSFGQMKKFNLQRQVVLQEIDHHHNRILKIAGSEARIYASVGHTVLVWDVDSKKLVLKSDGSALKFECNGAVQSLALSSDNKVLVTGDDSGLIKIWNTDNGNLVREINVGPLVLSLQISQDDGSIVSLTDNALQYWDMSSGDMLKEINVGGYRVEDLDVSEDGFVAIAAIDRVLIFDSDGEPYSTFENKSDAYSVKFLPGEKTVVFGANPKAWNYETGELLYQYKKADFYSGFFNETIVTKDYLVCKVIGGMTCIWDLKSKKLLATLRFSDNEALYASHDGTLITDGVIAVNSREIIRAIRGKEKPLGDIIKLIALRNKYIDEHRKFFRDRNTSEDIDLENIEEHIDSRYGLSSQISGFAQENISKLKHRVDVLSEKIDALRKEAVNLESTYKIGEAWPTEKRAGIFIRQKNLEKTRQSLIDQIKELEDRVLPQVDLIKARRDYEKLKQDLLGD